MSAGAQIDYEALAKQAGAINSQPAASSGNVDYAALAKQAGAISSQPGQGGSSDQPDNRSFLRKVWDAANTPTADFVLPKGVKTADIFKAIGFHALGMGEYIPGVNDEHTIAEDSAKAGPLKAAIRTFVSGATADTANMAAGFTSPVAIGTMAAGAASKVPGAIGTVGKALTGTASAGFAAKGAADIYQAGTENTPEAWQKRLQGGAMVAGGAAGAGVAGKDVPEILKGGWRKIGNPMGLASTGEELLTQGIGPRASMVNFKPSLERAAADLKAFDAESPIRNVQDLNDAIPEIKQKIWSEEVEPSLRRQANAPVNMKPVAQAVRAQISNEMREFDEGNAAKLDNLADKLESARDVASANRLLKYVNGQLESYFQKFPAARRANLMSNPETAGWEAARAELRNQFLGTLEDAGETGVRDARLRYGAFDTLQDAVERRVNVADRAKPMSLGRIVGLAAAVPTGGLSVVAGELSNYLNKPDVLVRRGISKLPNAAYPPSSRYALPPGASGAVSLASLLGLPQEENR